MTFKTLWGGGGHGNSCDSGREYDTDNEVRYLLVVPAELKKEVLCQLHNSRLEDTLE